jgi:hypothetical protein
VEPGLRVKPFLHAEQVDMLPEVQANLSQLGIIVHALQPSLVAPQEVSSNQVPSLHWLASQVELLLVLLLLVLLLLVLLLLVLLVLLPSAGMQTATSPSKEPFIHTRFSVPDISPYLHLTVQLSPSATVSFSQSEDPSRGLISPMQPLELVLLLVELVELEPPKGMQTGICPSQEPLTHMSERLPDITP